MSDGATGRKLIIIIRPQQLVASLRLCSDASGGLRASITLCPSTTDSAVAGCASAVCGRWLLRRQSTSTDVVTAARHIILMNCLSSCCLGRPSFFLQNNNTVLMVMKYCTTVARRAVATAMSAMIHETLQRGLKVEQSITTISRLCLNNGGSSAHCKHAGVVVGPSLTQPCCGLWGPRRRVWSHICARRVGELTIVGEPG